MSHKRDLQIICNIQWKTKPGNGGANKVNIVGFCDMPATTLSWDHFKSYLLTNSGISEGYDDIIVYYRTEDGAERAIQSQIDFQIALYTFRRQARLNEIINITLDRISDHKGSFTMAAEVKAHPDVKEPPAETGGPSAPASAVGPPDWFTNYIEKETPPKWFTDFMQTFKQDLMSDVNANIDGCMENLKAHFGSMSSTAFHTRRAKESKRAHKYIVVTGDTGKEKEFSKMERKLENKLEKLEHKTKKIKEKKMALANNHHPGARKASSSGTYRVLDDLDDVTPTRAAATAPVEDTLPQAQSDEETFDQYQVRAVAVGTQRVAHVCQGEVYKHTWDIRNDGTKAWDDQIDLRFTWGSKSLVPLTKTVPCPRLKPKEIGKVTVQMVAPDLPGSYESYWHLYYCGKRFGDWFGCQVIVDAYPFDELRDMAEDDEVKNILSVVKNTSELTISGSKNEAAVLDVSENNLMQDATDLASVQRADSDDSSVDLSEDYEFCNAVTTKSVLPEIVAEAAQKTVNEEVKEATVCQSSTPNKSTQDDVNKSVDSADKSSRAFDTSSNSSSVVRVDHEMLDETKESTDDNKDMVFISFDNTNNTEGYAYVFVDDKRIPVPKRYLRQDYLQTAEDAPNPSPSTEPIDMRVRVCSDNNSKTSQTDSSIDNTDDENVMDAPFTSAIANPVIEKAAPVSNLAASCDTCSKKASTAAKPVSCDCSINWQSSSPNTSFMTQNQCSYASHCSATGSCYSDINGGSRQPDSRLFIFPQDCPGYEVVSPRSCQESMYMDASQYRDAPIHLYPALSDESEVSAPPSAASAPVVGGQSSLPPRHQLPAADYPAGATFHPDLLAAPLGHFSYVTPPAAEPRRRSPAASSPSAPAAPAGAAGDGGCISQQPLHQHENVHDVFSYGYPQPSSPQSQVHGGPAMSDSCRSEAGGPATVHILPETLVTGAVNVASSAINTARSVINMITRPEPGRWVNGHWVSTNAETPREANLRQLAEMGFYNRDLNATLLARYNDDVVRVISDLIQ